jgi:cell shape-determining protein MreC
MEILSTLTKILVVLLSLFAIFLCGLMVSYVGSANNYKALHDQGQLALQTIQAENLSLTALYEEQVAKTKELETKKDLEIQSLQARLNQLTVNLQQTEQLKQEYQSRADSWKGVMTGFEQSVSSMLDSLNQTREQLVKSRSDNIKDQKELNQITADLYEKIVELQRLEADRRRILEQKTDIEKQMAQLSTTGKSSVSAPVTQVPNMAQPAPMVAAAAINGLVSELNGSLVTLSVGTADGVEKGMVLHITRGSEFLCDVVVTDVDVNKCAGVLEMIQQRPKVGDTASTKL